MTFQRQPRSARRIRRTQAGLTLIETLVSLGVTAVLLGAAGNVLLQGIRSQSTYQQSLSSEVNARTAIDMIADDMKGAVKFTSTVTSGSVQKTLPNQTVINATTGDVAATSVPNEDDYLHPVTFDVYSDSGGLRRVRYWRRLDSNLGIYVLRREIVTDSLSNNVRTASEAASGPDAGRMIARNVERFAVQKPYDTTSNTTDTRFDLVRITLATMEGASDNVTAARTSHNYQKVSRATVQTDVNLRNNSL